MNINIFHWTLIVILHSYAFNLGTMGPSAGFRLQTADLHHAELHNKHISPDCFKSSRLCRLFLKSLCVPPASSTTSPSLVPLPPGLKSSEPQLDKQEMTAGLVEHSQRKMTIKELERRDFVLRRLRRYRSMWWSFYLRVFSSRRSPRFQSTRRKCQRKHDDSFQYLLPDLGTTLDVSWLFMSFQKQAKTGWRVKHAHKYAFTTQTVRTWWWDTPNSVAGLVTSLTPWRLSAPFPGSVSARQPHWALPKPVCKVQPMMSLITQCHIKFWFAYFNMNSVISQISGVNGHFYWLNL